MGSIVKQKEIKGNQIEIGKDQEKRQIWINVEES